MSLIRFIQSEKLLYISCKNTNKKLNNSNTFQYRIYNVAYVNAYERERSMDVRTLTPF